MKGAINMPPNLLEFLDDIPFPAEKPNIVLYAETNGASEEAVEFLRALPDKNYENMRSLNAALGLIGRQHGSENLWSS